MKSIITDYPIGIQVDGIFQFSDLMRNPLNTGLLPSRLPFVITDDKQTNVILTTNYLQTVSVYQASHN
jgi:hypothetical protein